MSYHGKYSRLLNFFFSNYINNLKMEDLYLIEKVLDLVLDIPYEPIIINDSDGNILYINKAFAEAVNMQYEKAVEGKVHHIIGDNTRMHIVAKSSRHELGAHYFKKRNVYVVSNRIPLASADGKKRGAYGQVLFTDISEYMNIAHQLERKNSFSLPSAAKHSFYPNKPAKYSLSDIITQNKQMIEIKQMTQKAAFTKSSVLLQGESGVGKELFAHAIHKNGPRATNPFIIVNCASIPDSLFESELFGYEEGAFTGAHRGGYTGKFEQANGGTVFLDEVGELPLKSQAKLLRVLQEKEIEKIGGNRRIPLDIRIISATNNDLLNLCREGKFRKDLYYRLSVCPVTIPPLRERKEDIPLLISHFIDHYNREYQLNVKTVDRDSLKRMVTYDWPGNVRELQSVIEAALNRVDRNEDTLRNVMQDSINPEIPQLTLKQQLDQFERSIIVTALNSVDWDKTMAAELLDISLPSLYRKMKQLGIE